MYAVDNAAILLALSRHQLGAKAMPSHINNPIFHDEDAARAWFEARIWPNGPFCPHCGETENHSLAWQSARPVPFNATTAASNSPSPSNTVCERSKISLSKWCMAIYLINASKKGMSAFQMHRMMGGSYKTAWFMMHRIREAMRESKMLGPRRRRAISSRPTKRSSAARKQQPRIKAPQEWAREPPKGSRHGAGGARRQGSHVSCPECHR